MMKAQNKSIGQEGKAEIEKQFKEILDNESLTWEKVGEITGDSDRSNTRRKFLTLLTKANQLLNKIGYGIHLYKLPKEVK